MPMWLTTPLVPLPKVRRSPGSRCNVSFTTVSPTPACCRAVRGTSKLNNDITYGTGPLQWKPRSGDCPPRLYLVPSWLRAICTTESRSICAETLNGANGASAAGMTNGDCAVQRLGADEIGRE